jgi:RNA polymerase primary sigma factor
MNKLQFKTRITPRDTHSIESYLHEINQFPIPTIEEEVELAQRIHNGDEQALDRLVTGNLRFVVSVAKNYLNRGLDFPDLISAGNIGLIKAARRFDETLGIKFCSYAVWWIRQSVMEALNKEGRPVKLPANKIAFLMKMNKERSRLEQKLHHTPTLSEVTESMQEDEARVGELMLSAERPVSLDAPMQGDEELTKMDTLTDPAGKSTDDALMQESMRHDLQKLLSILPESERKIIELAFGINLPYAYSMGEIAVQMKLSDERVRQIHNKAIRRLQGSNNIEPLRGYL